jgi:predicted phage terminase large subunit-like protein
MPSTLTAPQASLTYWRELVRSRPELMTPRLTPFIPHRPTPKQAAFLLLPGREALYGGAAGGGKSDALLMAALQYVDVPGYAAILLRRTYKDLSLPGAIMDRAFEWLAGTAAHWNDEKKTWTFPSTATLTFGYLEYESHCYQYQGAEFQFIGFDELTQFQEKPYRYLFSRLRRLAGVTVPLRQRGATNPGGIGHEWVKQRFLIEGRNHGRVFIPARLDDNPHLDRAEYEASLAELDPTTRAQLLAGDWDARIPGEMFQRSWFEIVDAAPADLRWVRYWDMAATKPKPGHDPDWTAGPKVGRSPAGIYYIADLRRLRDTPAHTEALIKQTAQLDGIGTNVYMEQEPGSSGVTVIDHFTRMVLGGFTFHGDKVTGNKSDRAGPFSSQAQAGNVKLVRGPWINAFLDEVELFPNGAHDDQVDAVSGAIQMLGGSKPTGGIW